MDIQNLTSPASSQSSPVKVKTAQTSNDKSIRIQPATGEKFRDFRLQLIEDMDSLNTLELPQFEKMVESSDLKMALQSYSLSEDVPERRVWESRLQELSQENSKLAKAEETDIEQSKKKNQTTWHEDLKPVKASPQENTSIRSHEKLFRLLGIKEMSAEAKTLKELFAKLSQHSQNGPRLLGYAHEIAKDHGIKKLIEVCQTLIRFMDEQGTKEEPVDPGELVSCALRDMAHPNGIGQGSGKGGKGTCAASCIMCKLAAEKPGQYAEMLTTLAAGKEYKAPRGHTIKPNNTWIGGKMDNRRLSEKIMQNAIMDQRGRPYDSQRDDENNGMTGAEVEKAHERVFGYRNSEFDYETEGLFTSKQDLWSYIQDDLARGRPVSVSFSGHAILITGFDPTSKPPQVEIATWGKSYTMDLNKFLRHLKSVQSRDDSGFDNKKLSKDKRHSVLDDTAS